MKVFILVDELVPEVPPPLIPEAPHPQPVQTDAAIVGISRGGYAAR